MLEPNFEKADGLGISRIMVIKQIARSLGLTFNLVTNHQDITDTECSSKECILLLCSKVYKSKAKEDFFLN